MSEIVPDRISRSGLLVTVFWAASRLRSSGNTSEVGGKLVVSLELAGSLLT
jgi:hypothetical protein